MGFLSPEVYVRKFSHSSHPLPVLSPTSSILSASQEKMMGSVSKNIIFINFGLS